jgi:hypothetical protein
MSIFSYVVILTLSVLFYVVILSAAKDPRICPCRCLFLTAVIDAISRKPLLPTNASPRLQLLVS